MERHLGSNVDPGVDDHLAMALPGVQERFAALSRKVDAHAIKTDAQFRDVHEDMVILNKHLGSFKYHLSTLVTKVVRDACNGVTNACAGILLNLPEDSAPPTPPPPE